MPRTLRLSDGGYMRHLDVHNLLQYLYTVECVQVVGFSNVGKSALLRLLSQPDVWTQELGEAGHEFLAVYVDCNRMLEMSDQGFYELAVAAHSAGSKAVHYHILYISFQTVFFLTQGFKIRRCSILSFLT